LNRGCLREGVLGRGERRMVTVHDERSVSSGFKRGTIFLGARKMDDKPLAIPNSPAVSSARVASLGRFSRTTEAAIVMGRAASWSGSASGGAEEGEGEGEGDGDGEGMMFVVVFFFF